METLNLTKQKRHDNIMAIRADWNILLSEPTVPIASSILSKSMRGGVRVMNDGSGNGGGDSGSVVDVIDVSGVIEYKSAYGASILGINAMLDMAIESKAKALVLVIDSPGGVVAGLDDLASKLRGIREQKSVIAYVPRMACSAAYWLASQASEIIVGASAEVGSVGVIALHYDMSGYYEQEGIKITSFYRGENKTDGMDSLPPSESFKGYIEGAVDKAYKDFINAVMLGRGEKKLKPEGREEWEGAQILNSLSAKKLGLIDRVNTPDQFMEYLVSKFLQPPSQSTYTRKPPIYLPK